VTREAPTFAPLPVTAGGFACVHADPPIRFRSNSRERPGRNAMRHYRCYDYLDFEKLPVADVVARDAYLFLWAPGPFLVIGAHLPLVRAWGFKPGGIAFTCSLNPTDRRPKMNEARRTTLAKIARDLSAQSKPLQDAKDALDLVLAELRDVEGEEQEAFENRSEGFRATEAGQESEAAIGEMESAESELEVSVIDAIKEASSQLESAVNALKSVIGSVDSASE
jgi:hypothetical protein